MKLITKELQKKTPKLGTQSGSVLENLTFYIKLFTPWSNWTWYVAEADFETGECFGLVEGFEKELGYFNLKELEQIKGPGGLKIERDMYFQSKKYPELTK
jgi:hypothetical protein